MWSLPMIKTVFEVISYQFQVKAQMLKAWKILPRTTARALTRQYFFCTKPPTDSPNAQAPAPPSTQIQISEVAQKAMWASKAYEIIILGQEQFDESVSLRDKILNSKIQNWKMDEVIREESLKLFTQGVKFDLKVFGQECFRNGTQIIQITKQNKQIIKKHKKQINSPFIFCPNVMVTSKMFKTIYQSNSKIIIYGGYGVSKSVSLALLCHLNWPIHKFIHKQQKMKKQKDKQPLEAKLSQSELLKDFIDYNMSRFWYWAIEWAQVQERDFRLQQILLRQAHQLTEQEKDQLRKIDDFSDFCYELKKKYNYTTNRIIIDQINALASKIRIWNGEVDNYYALIKQLEKKKRWQSDQKKKKEFQYLIRQAQDVYKQKKKTQYPLIQKVIYLVREFMKLSSLQTKAILSSSMNIQKSILLDNPEIYRHPQKLNLGFRNQSNHDPLWPKYIQFSQSIKTQWGRKDYFDFFWFQIERLLKLKNVSKEYITLFKPIFYKKYKSFQPRSFYRLVNIYIHLQQSIDLDQILSLLKKSSQLETQIKTSDKQKKTEIRAQINKIEQIIADIISRILLLFDQFCFKSCIQKLEQFYNKKNDSLELQYNKKVLLELFYFIALEYSYNKRGQQQIQLPIKLLERTFTGIYPITNILLSDYHNKEMIPVRYDQTNKMVILDWNANDFLKIAGQIIDLKLNAWINRFNSQQLRRFFVDYHSPYGFYIQFLLGEIFKLSVQPNFIYSKSFESNQKRQIFDNSTFTHFNKDASPLFKQNFKPMIDLAYENPGKIMSGVPVTDDGFLAVNSKVMDFAFLKYSKQKDHYYVNTLYASIDQDGIPDKMENAFLLFDKLIQKLGDQRKFYDFEHTFLCKKSSMNTYQVQKGWQKIKLHYQLQKRKKEGKPALKKEQLKNIKQQLKKIPYQKSIPPYMKEFKFSYKTIEKADFKTNDVVLYEVVDFKAWIRMLQELKNRKPVQTLKKQ